ncbi:MAG: FkbM family methyltransferase [Gammaproteobacteria bacterium]|nr:FkbM family methyltransferase [Gammaproteobacteria bacterium]NNM00129.1 FkbM family methyltransferase [Gammaproteobacteria bacterium]
MALVSLKKIYWKFLKRLQTAEAPPSQSVVLHGRSFTVRPAYTSHIKLAGAYEDWLDKPLTAALAARSGAVIDVGANLGQTLVKLLKLGPVREYIGFEPQVDCAFFIDDFIRHNDLATHRLLPLGLSDRSAVVDLYKKRDAHDATASTIDGFRPEEFYTTRQAIYVARGDDVLQQLDLEEIAIIKVDVEGGELEVLKGLQETLRSHAPIVFFEVLNHFLVATGQPLDDETISFREQRCHELEGILRGLDYEIFNIRPDGSLVEVREIQPIVSDDLRITDYVAVPGPGRDAFLGKLSG